jgi:hypothetical protein
MKNLIFVLIFHVLRFSLGCHVMGMYWKCRVVVFHTKVFIVYIVSVSVYKLFSLRDAYTKLLASGELSDKCCQQTSPLDNLDFTVMLAKICFFCHFTGMILSVHSILICKELPSHVLLCCSCGAGRPYSVIIQ